MLKYNKHNCDQNKIPTLLHGQQILPGALLDLSFFKLAIVTSLASSALIKPRSFQKSFYCRIRQAVVFCLPIGRLYRDASAWKY